MVWKKTLPLILFVGLVSSSPTWRPPTKAFGSNYYQRLNLDIFKTDGVYGGATSNLGFQGGLKSDSGRRDDGTRFSQADISARGEKNVTAGIGLGPVHGGGDVIATGGANLSSKVERGGDEHSSFAQGELGGGLEGSLITIGGVGKDGEHKLQGGGSVSAEGDGRLTASGGVGRDDQGGRTAGGELGAVGRGRLRGDIGTDDINVGGDMNTSGDGKVSANAGFGTHEYGARGGGELQAEGRGRLSADGGVGNFTGTGYVDASGKGLVTAGGGYSKTDNSAHVGGDLGASGQGKVVSNVGVGQIVGEGETQASGEVTITAGTEYSHDNNSVRAGGELKTSARGDVTSQLAVGDLRGKGHIDAFEESKLAAGAEYSSNDTGSRVGGQVDAPGHGGMSSMIGVGDHVGRMSVNAGGEGKISSGAETISNDTAAHAGSHLGGAAGGKVVSKFGANDVQGYADASGAIQGNLTGDAIIYSDLVGIHGNAEAKAMGRSGLTGYSEVGEIYGKGNALANGEAKIGGGAELVSDDNGVHGEGRVEAVNQGVLGGNAEIGSRGPDGLRGYANAGAVGTTNISMVTRFGEDSNGTLYAGSQVGAQTGGKVSGGAGIRGSKACTGVNGDEVVVCQNVLDGSERIVYADVGAEGRGEAVARAGVSMDRDDSVVAVGEVFAAGRGKLSGGSGIGGLRGSGDVGTVADGKIYTKAGLLTDDEGGVQGVAEAGTKGKGNIYTNANIGNIKGRGEFGGEGDGKVFAETMLSKDRNGDRQIVSGVGARGAGSLNSTAAVGSVEGSGGLRGAGESKVTFMGKYGKPEDGSTNGKAEVIAETEGKLRAGAGVGNRDGLHGHGAVAASGHGKVNGETEVRRASDGDMAARAGVGGSVGGSLWADGEVGASKDRLVPLEAGVSGGAEGKLSGEFNKTKEHGVHANAEANSSASGRFRFNIWG